MLARRHGARAFPRDLVLDVALGAAGMRGRAERRSRQRRDPFDFVAVLARSGALAPDRLMNQSRSPLANLSGLAVLLTLFGATTQATPT